eukprot:scaffold359_cov313-Prasinococcus_capsulatus_cf.AAC.2
MISRDHDGARHGSPRRPGADLRRSTPGLFPAAHQPRGAGQRGPEVARRASERASERTGERTGERASERGSEQASKQASKQAGSSCSGGSRRSVAAPPTTTTTTTRRPQAARVASSPSLPRRRVGRHRRQQRRRASCAGAQLASLQDKRVRELLVAQGKQEARSGAGEESKTHGHEPAVHLLQARCDRRARHRRGQATSAATCQATQALLR